MHNLRDPNVPTGARQSQSSLGALNDSHFGFEISTTLRTVQKVVLSFGIFEPRNTVVQEVLNGRRAVWIADNGFLRQKRDALNALAERTANSELIIGADFSEKQKSLDAVCSIIGEFERLRLARRDVVIAIGGGVCCDVVSFAAAVYRRGIQHIKIPTTLLGIVDAGIGSKNAVNFENVKNRIGTFFPPEYSILDPSFSRLQKYEEFRCGVAEMLKVAVVTSEHLFVFMESVAAESRSTLDLKKKLSGRKAVELAVQGLLQELAVDLYEVGDLRRPADFGHSFSPELEAYFGGRLAHGDAVALEILILTEVSRLLGWIDNTYVERLYTLYRRLRLPMMVSELSEELIWQGLCKTQLHRGGSLNMPVPVGRPGHCKIIGSLGEIDPTAIGHALNAIRARLNAGVVLECS